MLFGGFVFLWCIISRQDKKSPKTLKIIFFWVYAAACFNGVLMEFIQRIISRAAVLTWATLSQTWRAQVWHMGFLILSY